MTVTAAAATRWSVMTHRATALAFACSVAALTAVVALTAAPATAFSGQPVTWSSAQARVPYAQSPGHYGAGVTVAVLDTWIDASHPDFGGRVLAGADCVGGSCHPGLAPADSCEPHATHVAGIVASTTYGVAPSARILPVRVLSWQNGKCTANSADVARAVDWAAAHGARVINISLGTALKMAGQVTDVAAAVERASAAGILVIAAAGNEQAPVGNSYGADAVVVAATGPSGQLASYSQRGNGVDLAAPGGDPVGPDCDADRCVVSTWSGHQFAAFAGTSMAAPQVAGTAALLWGQHPDRSRADVLARLTSTARPLAQAGSGLLDASGALGVQIRATTRPQQPAPPVTVQQPAAGSGIAPVVVAPTPKPRLKPTHTPVAEKRPTSAKRLGSAAGQPVAGSRTLASSAQPDRAVPISLATVLLLLVGGGWLAVRPRGSVSW